MFTYICLYSSPYNLLCRIEILKYRIYCENEWGEFHIITLKRLPLETIPPEIKPWW